MSYCPPGYFWVGDHWCHWTGGYSVNVYRAGHTLEDAAHLAFGAYECPTSPTGRCIYDDRDDPAHDDCLFCHDPSERK